MNIEADRNQPTQIRTRKPAPPDAGDSATQVKVILVLVGVVTVVWVGVLFYFGRELINRAWS